MPRLAAVEVANTEIRLAPLVAASVILLLVLQAAWEMSQNKLAEPFNRRLKLAVIPLIKPHLISRMLPKT